MTVRSAEPDAIEQAARLLIAGQVVAFPTETVYGLGADAASEAGVAAIYRIKGRPAGHPLIVHVLDAQQAAWWGELGEFGEKLINAFWPGPLTLIVRRRAGVPAHACGNELTVGLRSPSHPVARQLLDAFTRLGGHGVAAPSANRFGRVSPTRAEHVADDLGGDVPLVLDGGACEVGVESTIIDLSRGHPVLLRPGGVDAEEIARVLGTTPAERDAQAPRASGTLAAHYAPRTPLELVRPEHLVARLSELQARNLHVGIWSRQDPRQAAGGHASAGPSAPGHTAAGHLAGATRRSPGAPGADHWQAAPACAQAYARELYGTLRQLDSLGLQRMLIEDLPMDPAWDAVRDRLMRAAATFAQPETPAGGFRDEPAEPGSADGAEQA